MSDLLPFPDDFQDMLIAAAIRRSECDFFLRLLKPQFFTDSMATAAWHVVLQHYRETSELPTFAVLSARVSERLQSQNRDPEAGVAYVRRLREMDTTRNMDYVTNTVEAFARRQAMLVAIRNAIENYKDGKEPDGAVVAEFEAAMAIKKSDDDLGLLFDTDSDAIIDRLNNRSVGVRTGWPQYDEIWRRGWEPGWLIVPLAPPKRFKCEVAGTELLMHDGTVKKVEDIVVGDVVMGDDSQPRKVLECGSGRAPMYHVSQSNGDSYTVTDDHVLVLSRQAHTAPKGTRFKDRYSTDCFLEISAKDYATKPTWFKRTWKGYKVGVDFPSQELPLEPYYLGVWLGDGDTRTPGITAGDAEVVDYMRGYANRLGLELSEKPQQGCLRLYLCRHGKHNPATQKLQDLDLLMPMEGSSRCDSRKHIPHIYKQNDRTSRLQLLAGLIDSDGSHQKNRGFIFVNTNKVLADDTCWLARSLGFKSFVLKVNTSIKKLNYRGIAYRVYVQGKISEIPTRIARKRGVDSAKATNRTTIKVTPVGEDAYYGFLLDGNHRYLHSDFTVTHNSLYCTQLALNMVGPNVGADVLYYPCEISADLTAARMFSNLTRIPQHVAYEGNIEDFKQTVRSEIAKQCTGKLLMKDFPSKSVTINDIRAHAKMAIRELGITPKAIFIDYAETVRPSDTKISEHQQQANIYVEARALGAELGCCVVMPDRCNKDTVGMPVPSMKSFQGAFQKAGAVDIAVGLCATDEEYEQDILRQFIFLNRHGRAFQHFSGKVDAELASINVGDLIETPIGELFESGGASGGRKRKADTRAMTASVMDDDTAAESAAAANARRVDAALQERQERRR